MTQVEIARLSWKQAEEAFKKEPVILIPIGAVEAHGPHLPLGADTMVAHEVSVRAAEQSEALVVPPIWYGYAAYWRKYAGNISVRAELVKGLAEDIIHSLLPFGLQRFIFVNNHSSNEEVLEFAARELREKHGLHFAHFYPWRVMPQFAAEFYDDFAAASGHGAEPATSVMMHLYPDDVDMGLAVKDGLSQYHGLDMIGGNAARVGGVSVELYVDMDEINPSGVMSGDPFVASPERGRLLLERTAAILADFTTKFRNLPLSA